MVGAAIGIGASAVTIVIALVIAGYKMGGRFSALEAKLENLITVRDCGELRESLRKDWKKDLHHHEEHHHEVSGVKAPSWPPGGGVPS